ncbi:MAG: hypothetical protein QOG72_2901 [Sphingomonadales bacterium]|nr:hypothetical protein [Sphingomonadales bacterium]
MPSAPTSASRVSSNPPDKDEAEESAPAPESDSALNKSLAKVDPEDEAKLEQIAELLPPEKRGELLAVIEKTVSHSGWLPTPDDLAAYETILPGLAERIVAMPEREQKHRHEVIENALDRDYQLKHRGQTLAITSMVLLLAFSGCLAALGEIAWAARVAIFTIVAVVGIFVTGKVVDARTSKDTDE